jgi:hypothetical protein
MDEVGHGGSVDVGCQIALFVFRYRSRQRTSSFVRTQTITGDTMTMRTARMFARLTLVPCLAAALVLGALSSPTQAHKVRADFFGMHDNQISNGEIPGVPLGAIRLWDAGTSWRQIETLPGSYDFSVIDRAVNYAVAAGIRPLVVLGQTPQFYAENPMASGAYGDGASSMPQLDAWKAYVSAVASRYGAGVDYQIWNEPNVINYWSGTVAQMAQLTASASQVITKVAGSNATVVGPGFPLRLTYQQKWFKKYWSAKSGGKGMASYVDVVAVHLYPAANEAPEASMKLLSFAKGALPKAARKLPVWNTEINYGLRGGPPAKKISEARQASFVARTLLLNAASPVRRMYWYAWAQGGIANTHLVLNDRTTLTKGGRAWREVRDWLIGTTTKSCSPARSGKLKGLYTCSARKSKTEMRRFYWKPSGKAVKISTNKTTKTWTDLRGHTTHHKGKFQIKVGESPIMVTSRR